MSLSLHSPMHFTSLLYPNQNPPLPVCLERMTNSFLLHRKERKRSHTLRYTLKNRATGKVLFVVLFTLYLKEDVDAEGRVKEGIEGGMPFDLMPPEEANRYRRAANGEATQHAEEDYEEAEAELEERMKSMKVEGKENKTAPGAFDDDDGVD